MIRQGEQLEYESKRFKRKMADFKEKLQIYVEGAGDEDINGVYKQEGFVFSAFYFYREGDEDNYYIQQAQIKGSSSRWYIISDQLDLDEFDNEADKHCFYSALVKSNRHLPPNNGWVKEDAAVEGNAPELKYPDG